MREATRQDIEKLPYSAPFLDGTLKLFYADVSDGFMADAQLVRDAESTDRNHSTGAVIVKDGMVLSMAANQAGFKHSSLIKLHERGWCVRKILKVKSGTHYWLCPGCAKHSDHAESRACRLALEKHEVQKVKGSTLYLYGHYWCCKPCSLAMISAGVANVVLLEGAEREFKKR